MGRTSKNNKRQNEKSVTGRDALMRMNYLYQAATLLSTLSSSSSSSTSASTSAPSKSTLSSQQSLSRFYSRTLKGVAGRMVLRMDPSVKRTICKRCDSILVPGFTSTVAVDTEWSQHAVVRTTCNTCGLDKSLPCNPAHVLFTEREGVVVVGDKDE